MKLPDALTEKLAKMLVTDPDKDTQEKLDAAKRRFPGAGRKVKFDRNSGQTASALETDDSSSSSSSSDSNTDESDSADDASGSNTETQLVVNASANVS